MKHLFKLTFALLFILCSLVSCNNDDDSNGNTEESPTLTKNTVSAKWNITGANNIYSSFEFNESGNYIIVEQSPAKSTKKSIVYFGSYTISNDNTTMALAGLGTIKVSAIDSNNFSFSLILDSKPGETIKLNAKRDSEIAKSTSTELLCKTWEVKKYFVNSIETDAPNLTILFSKAGTYFVDWKDEPENGGLAKWRWVNNEKGIQYLWDDVWDDDDIVEINELTENLLKFTEIEENGTHLYELTPVDNTRASIVEYPFTSSAKSYKNKTDIFSRK